MFWPQIGDLLPPAVALGISPVAVITAVVLLLVGRRGRLTAALYGLGWLVTILVIAAVAYLIVDAADEADPADTDDGVNIAQLVFGLGFWALAGLSWRSSQRREGPGVEAKLLARLTKTTPFGALRLGLIQGVAVVKNIPLALSAGARLGESPLKGGEALAALIIFAIIATAGILGPLLAAVIGGEKLNGPMTAFRGWLEDNLTAISVVVMLMIGAVLVGRGLAVLS